MIQYVYRKVTTYKTSLFEAHAGLFRLSMKEIFNAYLLWPFGKNFIFELVTHDRTRDYTICILTLSNLEHKFHKFKAITSGFQWCKWGAQLTRLNSPVINSDTKSSKLFWCTFHDSKVHQRSKSSGRQTYTFSIRLHRGHADHT